MMICFYYVFASFFLYLRKTGGNRDVPASKYDLLVYKDDSYRNLTQ